MRSHPELSLRAMSESVTMQLHRSVSMPMAHIISREQGAVPGQGSFQGPPGYPGAMQNWPYPFLLYAVLRRALAPSIYHWRAGSTQKSRPCITQEAQWRAVPGSKVAGESVSWA